MNDERIRRIGHNEALYRQLNERIRELNETWATFSGDFAIACECGDVECMEQITVSPETYEQTRGNPHRFILKPGHEIDGVEFVVDRGEDGTYVVIEKELPEARQVAEETNPRS